MSSYQYYLRIFLRLQSFILCDGRDILTIAKKTAVDQFIFVTLWGCHGKI